MSAAATLGGDPAVDARFDRLCALVLARRKGVTLAQLGDAHALARLLEGHDPDPKRVAEFCRVLGLDPGAALPDLAVRLELARLVVLDPGADSAGQGT